MAFDLNDLSYGGRLDVHPFVDKRTVARAAEMLGAAKGRGLAGSGAANRIAETLSTSDMVFSVAHLINARNLEQYDEETNNSDWRLIASTDTAPDFREVTFHSLETNLDGLQFGKDTDGQLVSPKVAELDTYTYAYGYTQESAQFGVEKRGFKWGISLEAVVNDITRQLSRVPQDMLNVGLATDNFVVFRALTQGVTAVSQLQAGTPLGGEAVPANAAFSVDALRLSLSQISKREIPVISEDGQTVVTIRKPGLASRYYIVVSQGSAADIEYLLAEYRARTQVIGDNVISRPIVDPILGRISGVIESEFVEDGAWYVVPAAGTTRRLSLVHLSLQGYTAPEIYVSNFNGTPLAGGASSDAFRAFHFDNDSIDLKFRQFTNAGLINQDQLVWSTGEN